MADDIKLLEERVLRAVDRLKRLHEERGELRQEIKTLQERLERAVESTGGADRAGVSWKAERTEVTAAIREALDELREP